MKKKNLILTFILFLSLTSCNKGTENPKLKTDSFYIRSDNRHIERAKRKFTYTENNITYQVEQEYTQEVIERVDNVSFVLLCNAINNNPIDKPNYSFDENYYSDYITVDFIYNDKIDYQFLFCFPFGPSRVTNNVDNWSFSFAFDDYKYHEFYMFKNLTIKMFMDPVNPYVTTKVTQISQ